MLFTVIRLLLSYYYVNDQTTILTTNSNDHITMLMRILLLTPIQDITMIITM